MGDFRMPSLGADMEYGTLLEWLVQPGTKVRRGDVVAVVDTDKSTIDVEVFESGVVAELLVEPGERVPVGTVLARLTPAGERAACGSPCGVGRDSGNPGGVGRDSSSHHPAPGARVHRVLTARAPHGRGEAPRRRRHGRIRSRRADHPRRCRSSWRRDRGTASAIGHPRLALRSPSRPGTKRGRRRPARVGPCWRRHRPGRAERVRSRDRSDRRCRVRRIGRRPCAAASAR